MRRGLVLFGGWFLLSLPTLATDATTTLPSRPVELNSQDFENIRINEFVNLDSYEPGGSLSGVRLQCGFGEQRAGGASFVRAPGGNETITFCEDECGTTQTSQAQGPTTSLECANYIDQSIRACVEAMGCVSDIRFCGVGGHAKRMKNTPGGGNGSPSRHSSGDALDLFGIQCNRRSPGGGIQSFQMDFSSQGRAQHTEAYDAFVECWRDQMEASQPRANGHQGAIACTSAEPPRNELHNDHVHMSCPTPRQRTGGT